MRNEADAVRYPHGPGYKKYAVSVWVSHPPHMYTAAASIRMYLDLYTEIYGVRTLMRNEADSVRYPYVPA